MTSVPEALGERRGRRAAHLSGGDATPDEWNDFVRADPHGTFCHLAEWRGIMEDVLGHEYVRQVVRDADGRVVGIQPLVLVRAAPLGRYLLSMPFLNYGGPLGTPAAQQALASEALIEATRRDVDMLELRTRHASPAAGGALRVSHRKLTVLLDLPDTSDELWERGLKAKVRNQIRRPLKDGMEARFGPGEIAAFYDVFAHHMRDLGTPVLPRRYFERVLSAFGSIMEVCTVYDGDVPAAVGLGFIWGNEFEITRASALREYSRSAPNMLLYWALMDRCIRRGIRTFNFGRCSPGSGTHQFKRQWGGRDVPLPWLQAAGSKVTATPNDERGALRLAAALWRRMPLVLANRLGPALARRLP